MKGDQIVQNAYYWKPVFWSRSYCILTTGGATIEIIEKYIKSQAGVKD